MVWLIVIVVVVLIALLVWWVIRRSHAQDPAAGAGGRHAASTESRPADEPNAAVGPDTLAQDGDSRAQVDQADVTPAPAADVDSHSTADDGVYAETEPEPAPVKRPDPALARTEDDDVVTGDTAPQVADATLHEDRVGPDAEVESVQEGQVDVAEPAGAAEPTAAASVETEVLAAPSFDPDADLEPIVPERDPFAASDDAPTTDPITGETVVLAAPVADTESAASPAPVADTPDETAPALDDAVVANPVDDRPDASSDTEVLAAPVAVEQDPPSVPAPAQPAPEPTTDPVTGETVVLAAPGAQAAQQSPGAQSVSEPEAESVESVESVETDESAAEPVESAGAVAGYAVERESVTPSDGSDPMAARFGDGAASPTGDGSAPAGYAIKGNADSMLFHTPDSPRYAATRPAVWFRDEAAAVAAGFAHWDRTKRHEGYTPATSAPAVPDNDSGSTPLSTSSDEAVVSGTDTVAPQESALDTSTTNAFVAQDAVVTPSEVTDAPQAPGEPATDQAAEVESVTAESTQLHADSDVESVDAPDADTAAGPAGAAVAEDAAAPSVEPPADAAAAEWTDVTSAEPADADAASTQAEVVPAPSVAPEPVPEPEPEPESQPEPELEPAPEPAAADTASASVDPDEGVAADDPIREQFGAGAASPREDGGAPSGAYVIKGNADSMLFHTSDSPSFEATEAEVWFVDEDAAKNAGFKHWDHRKR